VALVITLLSDESILPDFDQSDRIEGRGEFHVKKRTTNRAKTGNQIRTIAKEDAKAKSRGQESCWSKKVTFGFDQGQAKFLDDQPCLGVNGA
jgi:hypothetical protein